MIGLWYCFFRTERRDRATAWFVDVLTLAVSPLVVLLGLWNGAPTWLIVAATLLVCLRIARIKIVRDATPKASLRRYWFGVIPGRVRELPFESITSESGSRFSFDDDDDGGGPEVTFGAGVRVEILTWCLRPHAVAAWLLRQKARLAVPVARVVETRNGEGH